MSYTFDGINKLIIIDNGVTSFSVADLYSRWKDWFALSDNSKYETAFGNSVGGNSLGGGIVLGSYYFLQNGWKIRPQEANHVLEITGNLYPIPDTASLFQSTVGSFNVQIIMRNSSLTQGVTNTDISNAVWQASIDGGVAGEVLTSADKNAKVAVALSA
jgi:hypothetical protein